VLSEATDSTARGIQLLSICLFLLTRTVTTTRNSALITVRGRDSRLKNPGSDLVEALRVAIPMDSVAAPSEAPIIAHFERQGHGFGQWPLVSTTGGVAEQRLSLEFCRRQAAQPL